MNVRYFAFLRAINVGGHNIKMDILRSLFESLGLTGVETFIASGNVIFESSSSDPAAMEEAIAARLQQELGYGVATFVRTGEELAAIAFHRPFPLAELDTAQALNVAFLARPLDVPAVQKLMELRTDIDDFHVTGREMYWLCRQKQSQSTFSNNVFERMVGRQATLRGINTLRRLVERYPVKTLA